MLRRVMPALVPVVVVLAALCSVVAAADVLRPVPGGHQYPVGLDLEVLEDETASLEVDAVASSLYGDRFRPVGRERPNYGFRRSALWFRLQVDFTSAAAQQWHLVESHPIIDEVSFHYPDGKGGWVSVDMGDSLPFGTRPYRLREFVLPVPPAVVAAQAQPVTFYVRIAGQGALNLDLSLVDAQGLAERTAAQLWIYGLFYGALGIMLLYNLFLYLSTRERSQFHYIVFLGGFILLFLSLNGFALQYLWPDFPAANGWFPVFTCIALWGGLQFTRSFLDIRKDNPRVDTSFRYMTHAVVVVFFLGLLLPRHWAYLLGTILPLFFGIVMFGAGVMRLRQGYQPARLFVAGWGVLLAGAVLLPLANLGLLPVTAVTEYSPQIGVVMQVVLLSLALGERMKLLKRENERIQQESHEKLAGMFAQLQNLDADKLRFLHYLSHELNTPLNWMSATRAAETGGMAPEVRAMVDAVEAGQQRMIDLVGIVLRYFDIAGEDPAQVSRAPVSPMWLVDDLLREHAGAIAARKLTVRNRVPADLVVQANEQRLRRVLACLLDNAVHFSGEGQEIEVLGGTETYGTRGVLVVRDQGRGIDPEQLPRLFEPFFMVGSHHREGGFGLSLATTRLLVEHMDGEMRVRSAGRGHGAEFQVVLPIAVSAAARSRPEQSPAA